MRLIDAEKLQHDNVDDFDSRYGDDAAKLFKDAIKYAPTVDAQPVVHAHWVQVDKTKCRCSNCDIIAMIALYPFGDKNFCPNCGAKMEESVKE